MFMEIVLGMKGNHSSGRGSQSLGRGRGSQQTVRGGGIQQFFSGNNTTNVLPHSPTCTEDTLASPPLDTSYCLPLTFHLHLILHQLVMLAL